MTARFDIALVREQGVDFAVVNVKRHVFDDRRAQEDLAATLVPHVGAIPVENDGLIWPHCDGLNWPHLRPIVV